MAITRDIAVKKIKNNVSSESYTNGVNATREAPGQKAVKSKDIYLKNTLLGKDALLKGLQSCNAADVKTKTIAGFNDLERKVIQAVDSGKWNVKKVIAAGIASSNAANALPRGDMNKSYDRYMASQNATIKTYGK